MGIRWGAVALGVVSSVASGWLFVLLAIVLQPQGASGFELVAVPLGYLLVLADGAGILLAALAAHLVGGAVAGAVSPGASAPNGAATAAVCAPVGIAWLLWFVPPFAFLPFVDPFTGSLDILASSIWAATFSVFFLLALVAGYAGGGLGGRLRPSGGEDAASSVR